MGVGIAEVPEEALEPAAQARLVAELTAGAERWAVTSLEDRAALLTRVHRTVADAAEEWVRAAVRLKGLEPGSPLVGEEWLSGPYAVLTGLARLVRTLETLAEGRSPLRDLAFHDAPGGRRAVDVLPLDATEALLLSGFRAEVWFPPGVTDQRAMLTAGLGAFYCAHASSWVTWLLRTFPLGRIWCIAPRFPQLSGHRACDRGSLVRSRRAERQRL